MKRQITRGTRYKEDSPTRRRAVEYTGDDAPALFGDQAKSQPPLDGVEALCWRILAEVGITPGPMLVKAPAPSAAALEWRKPERRKSKRKESEESPQYEAPPTGWHLTHPEGLAGMLHEFIPIDSTEGYACRMLFHIKQVRHWQNEGNVQFAVNEAFALGNLFGESRVAEWHSSSKSSAAKIKNADAREAAIQHARTIWDREPARIGDVVESIKLDGCEQSRSTIRAWLIAAEKEGRLTIPPAARRGGRPPRK